MNNRTHRKVLVVDGKVGFTGGVGIADAWSGHAQDPDHWRDTHFRAEGPVVAQMQAVFMDNWIKVTGEVLHGAEYFPPLRNAARAAAQMFSSSPEGGSESMQLMYLLAITAAAKSIHLSSAYFVPDDLSLKALVAAARRGVRVQIITPGEHMDAETVRKASRARWGELLEAGVEIFEYQPTMYHCKVMIVDGLWLSVGSTNFDSRSFSLNDEANLNISTRPLPSRQIAIFQQDARALQGDNACRLAAAAPGRKTCSSIRRRCCGCSCECGALGGLAPTSARPRGGVCFVDLPYVALRRAPTHWVLRCTYSASASPNSGRVWRRLPGPPQNRRTPY